METVLSNRHHQIGLHVGEPSEIAAARRAGNDLASFLGFNETHAGRVALVITEAATNIIKHARAGKILLRPVFDHANPASAGVEIVAFDSGPGMTNLAANMQDGNSSVGTYGVGLGTIRRQSDEFDVHTAPGAGTALYMLVWNDPGTDHSRRRKVGAVCLPLQGEEECGDAWTVVETEDGMTVLVADGLGHGPEAARASLAAVAAVAHRPEAAPAHLMHDLHDALRGTRGAAAAIAHLDFTARELRFTGVGNIAAAVHDGDARRHLVSHNGIVGNNMRKAQEFSLGWPDDALLIMHSDGIGTRWDLKNYPGLASRHPSLIAAILYRDFARARDDATVLVIREH